MEYELQTKQMVQRVGASESAVRWCVAAFYREGGDGLPSSGPGSGRPKKTSCLIFFAVVCDLDSKVPFTIFWARFEVFLGLPDLGFEDGR